MPDPIVRLLAKTKFRHEEILGHGWTLQVVCNDPALHEPVVCKERPQPVVPPPGICMQQSHLDVQAKRQTLGGRSISICTTPLWVGSISANTVGIEVWKELMLQVRVIQIQLVGSTTEASLGISLTTCLPTLLLSSPEQTFPLGIFSSGSAKIGPQILGTQLVAGFN